MGVATRLVKTRDQPSGDKIKTDHETIGTDVVPAFNAFFGYGPEGDIAGLAYLMETPTEVVYPDISLPVS